MKRNKRKTPKYKKPFLVWNRRKLAGWIVVVFLLCAWMFVLGVLVGRDTAPIKFDLKELQQKLTDSGQKEKAGNQGIAPGDPQAVKDKTKLGFYERLPGDQKNTTVPELKKQPGDNQKAKPAIRQPAASKKPAPKAVAKKVQPQKPAPKTKEKEQKKVSTAGTKKPTAPTGAVYTVQAAAFKNAEDADQLVARLKQKGFPAYRALGKVPEKGIWFRIRIGKYNSRAEASQTLNKLKKLGFKPIIVKQ